MKSLDLARRLALLEKLPASLYSAVITHHHGSLDARTKGIAQWRTELLAGRLPAPDQLCWPQADIATILLKRLESLELLDYCKGQASVTDAVLLQILEGVSSAEDYLRKTAGQFDDKLAQRQKIKDMDSSFLDEEGLADHVRRPDSGSATESGPSPQSTPPIPQTAGPTRQPSTDKSPSKHQTPTPAPPHDRAVATEADQAQATGAIASDAPASKPLETPTPASPTDQPSPTGAATADPSPNQPFGDLKASPSREPVLGEAANTPLSQGSDLSLQSQRPDSGNAARSPIRGRGWDLSLGEVQQGQDSQALDNYAAVLERHPQIKAFIAQLTAPQPRRNTPSQSRAGDGAAPRRNGTLSLQIASGGIERGADLNRQLPGELALLGHPRLKSLWHARRAESLLNLYQNLSPGLELAGASGPMNARAKPRHKSGHTPALIICVDSSASMAGEPETIAKAAALHALVQTEKAGQDAELMLFSGPDQHLHYRARAGHRNLPEQLRFVRQSFYGGTDIDSMLDRARLIRNRMRGQNVDILLISDGRFPATPALAAALRKQQQGGGRIHGLFIGGWQKAKTGIPFEHQLHVLCQHTDGLDGRGHIPGATASAAQ